MSGPLAGIRVIELTTAWAGPFAGRSLAYLGAEVIKIEAPSRPDHWRGTATGGAPLYYPDGVPGADAQNRNVLFNSQNMDKQSFALDLKVAGALDVLDDLVRGADVLMANFAPGVLDRLGVGHDRLSKINPRLIHVEMPAFGPGGPSSTHMGMGKTMEPAAGITALMGYDAEAPVLTGPAIMDPTGGLNAVAAIVTALELRERTGQGSKVQVPQVEAGAHWIGEYVLEQLEAGTTWTPDGNRAPGRAPHGAYPCSGEDQWVTIAVTDDDEWARLVAVIGHPELASRYASHADRVAHQDEIDAEIASWTSGRDKREAALVLQRTGVPAAPVLQPTEVAQEEALRAAGMVVTLDHPAAGRHEYSALAYRHMRTPGSHRRSAPLFGEHNDEVLRIVLGYDSDRIAHILETGIVTDRPTGDYESTSGPRPVAAT